MNMDMTAYREYIDNEMMVTFAQMDKPSRIFDYLYLVSRDCVLVGVLFGCLCVCFLDDSCTCHSSALRDHGVAHSTSPISWRLPSSCVRVCDSDSGDTVASPPRPLGS